jgi:predicted GTPase
MSGINLQALEEDVLFLDRTMICSKENDSVDMILKEVIKVRNQSQKYPTTGILNRMLQKAFTASAIKWHS